MPRDAGAKARPRDPQGRYTRSPDTAERDAQACRLRVSGLTYRQIADRAGYSHHDLARRAVERGLAAIVQEPAAELRTLELARLDTCLAEAFRVMYREHVVVSNGRVVLDLATGKPLPDDGPRLTAIDRIVKISERRAKLLGLDAPTRVEAITMDQIDAEILRLTAELGMDDGAAAVDL